MLEKLKQINFIPKNKKGFYARDWMVAFITGIAVIALLYLMVQGMATEYDNEDIIDVTFQNTYDKYEILKGDIDDIFAEASSEEGMSVIGTFTTLFSATFGVISIMFGTLLLPGAMLHQFMIDVGAPDVIAKIMFTLPITIVTIIIVLVIISFIGRGKM